MHESGLTRAERSERNRSDWANMRSIVPLGSPSFDGVEIPHIRWRPGDGPTEEVIEAVMGTLEQGPSLWEIKRRRPEYPSPSTFVKWVDADPELRQRYARARELQADAIAGLGIEVSAGVGREEGERDKIGAVQRDKLHSDALRWYAGKVSPRYNDKLQIQAEVEHKGGVLLIPGAPSTVEQWEQGQKGAEK